MEQDKETARLLHKARQFSRLVGNDSWKDAKEELVGILMQLDTISDIDATKDASSIKFTISVRQEIKRIMYNWLSGLEARARFIEKHDATKAAQVQFSHTVRR
jgi:hypothetical protein